MKVLVVEDDSKIAAVVQRALQAEGFTVDVAADGAEGLWLASEGSYDLVVLDIMLPKRNGFQICAALRAANDWTPVIVVTAKDGELDEAEALDTGADDYLTKPFAVPVLIARVRSVLRRAGARGAVVPASAGDLRIDPAGRHAWRAQQELILTARQFDVLEFLMRRQGQVVTKQQILDGVWQYDFDGDLNIVEVYIRRLRAVIDEPFGRHAIQTLRGAGYRLATDGG